MLTKLLLGLNSISQEMHRYLLVEVPYMGCPYPKTKWLWNQCQTRPRRVTDRPAPSVP